MSLETMPTLGTKPVTLMVKLPVKKKDFACPLAQGLRDMYRKGDFVDVSLRCAEQLFQAHRCVLATKSEVFRQGLAAPTVSASGAVQKPEVRLTDIANPEAVKFMLDYMYEMDADVWDDYNPRTQEINKDVLRLAQNFRLPGLTEAAQYWMAKDITTGNVVEVLAVCDEFGLSHLRERVLEQLTMNKRALAEVANSSQIMKYPKLMQALLQQAAGLPEEEAPEKTPPKKKTKRQ